MDAEASKQRGCSDVSDQLGAHRLVLTAIYAGAVMTAWAVANLAWPSRSLPRHLIGTTIALILAVGPTARTWVEVPILERGSQSSDRLWGIGLPSPEITLRRVLPIPSIPPSQRLRLRVNLAAEYRGPAFLVARINERDIGRLLVEGEYEGRSTVDACRELYFDASGLVSPGMASVELRQPTPDPRLLIAVFGTSRGTVAGADAAWISGRDGFVRGTPSALYGTVADGVPVVWLEAG